MCNGGRADWACAQEGALIPSVHSACLYLWIALPGSEQYWIDMIIGYCVSYDCMNDLVISRYLGVNWFLSSLVHLELWVLRVSAAGDAAVV